MMINQRVAAATHVENCEKKRYIGSLQSYLSGGPMDDSVARDAKRLLLRYGAPIAVVDKLSDDDRITFARTIIRTPVPKRPGHLRELLKDGGSRKNGKNGR
jgi:hypothetical protein